MIRIYGIKEQLNPIRAQLSDIGISMMEGRSPEARKKLIHLLFERIEAQLNISPIDVEITITEQPASNWGFRGMTGDEASLSYQVKV